MNSKNTHEKRIFIEKNALKKHLIIFTCLSIIGVLYIPFISTFFHELGHFICAKALGFSDARMFVFYPFGGFTTFDFAWTLPINDPQWTSLRIIIIAGSLCECLSMGSINILVTLYKKVPFSVSLPLFASTSTMIIYDIWYWLNGVYGPSYTYDAYSFINIPPKVNPIVVQYFTVYIGLLIIILLTLGLKYRFKKIKTKYKLPKEKNLPSYITTYMIIMITVVLIFILFVKPLFYFSIS